MFLEGRLRSRLQPFVRRCARPHGQALRLTYIAPAVTISGRRGVLGHKQNTPPGGEVFCAMLLLRKNGYEEILVCLFGVF